MHVYDASLGCDGDMHRQWSHIVPCDQVFDRSTDMGVVSDLEVGSRDSMASASYSMVGSEDLDHANGYRD